MKKILVVGGGIVGITSAYFAKNNENKVILVESSDSLGGLLKSTCNKYGCFDYGTHIATKTGVDELDDFLFSDFNENNCYKFNIGKSGNFYKGKLSDISPFVNTNHLDISDYQQGCSELELANNKVGKNLKETLINRYGDTFYQCIFKDLIYKNFGCDAQYLANECLPLFDMPRILAFDKEVSRQKKLNKVLDEKIGFHGFIAGVDKFYPKKGGIGHWIKNLEAKLLNLNIDIKTKSSITQIEANSTGFLVHINDDILQVDELVWTLSSALLNKFIDTGFSGIKPSFRKMAIYDFVFEKPLKTDSYYINVYDNHLLSNRITCYQNLQSTSEFYACSVEVLNEDFFDFESKIKYIEQELIKIGITEEGSKFSQCRILKEGFLSLTLDTSSYLKKINSFYEENFNNITLLGRSSDKGFFVSELLASAYHEVKKEHN